MTLTRWDVRLKLRTGTNPQLMSDPGFWRRILGEFFFWDGPDQLDDVVAYCDAPVTREEIQSAGNDLTKLDLEAEE